MEESKSGEVLVRYLDSMPVAFWAKVVTFLQATSAAALHATSAASSTHTTGTWSPRWEVASERAALAAVAGDASWEKLGWGGANPVGVATFVVAPGRHSAVLVQGIRLRAKRLRGARGARNRRVCLITP